MVCYKIEASVQVCKITLNSSTVPVKKCTLIHLRLIENTSLSCESTDAHNTIQESPGDAMVKRDNSACMKAPREEIKAQPEIPP